MTLLQIAVIVFLVVEFGYWFLYFPRKWKQGGNREIDDLRWLYRYLREKKPTTAPTPVGRILLKKRPK